MMSKPAYNKPFSQLEVKISKQPGAGDDGVYTKATVIKDVDEDKLDKVLSYCRTVRTKYLFLKSDSPDVIIPPHFAECTSLMRAESCS
jgi:hypothetical protein